jgi:predicted nuclease of predicted toxin-antitoxin system
MKLWFDDDLSPTLVALANSLGFQATCNRDRRLLNATDREVLAAADRRVRHLHGRECSLRRLAIRRVRLYTSTNRMYRIPL